MASIGRDPRTNNVVIRAYAGVHPDTKRDRTISTTLPAEATEEQVKAATEGLEARAAVLKRNAAAMTIGAALDWWFDNCEIKGMAATTISSYGSYLRRHVKPRVGSVFFDKADAATFSTLYRDLRKPKKEGGGGLAASTVEKIHSMLSGAFRTLKEDGVVPTNPHLGVKVARAKHVEIQPLMPEDYAALVTYLQKVLTTPVSDDEGFEAFMFAVLVWDDLHTGLRRGELAGAQDKHWLVRGGERGIRVARVLVQVKKKDGGESVADKEPKSLTSKRFVTVDAETDRVTTSYLAVRRAVLAEHGVAVTRETPLFCHADGSQLAPSQITAAFKDMAEKLKLAKGVHLHTLRHTHASYLLDHGASLKDIQERFGHSSIKVTGDIYGHLLPGRDKELADAAAEITREIAGSVFEGEAALFVPTCPLTDGLRVCARHDATDAACENLAEGSELGGFECSVCGGFVPGSDGVSLDFKVCPYCARKVISNRKP